MLQVDKVIKIAKSEIGYLEKKTNTQLDDKTANAGSNNWTKYARDMDALGAYNGKKNGYAWCDVFVDWCFTKAFGLDIAFQMTGQKIGGIGAGCTWSVNYYKNICRWYTSNPQIGDQIFFTNDGGKTSNHTGLVVKVDSNRVYTIEGNTASVAGVVANGGCVAEKNYLLTYKNILGYGRPKWELVKEKNEVAKEEVRQMVNDAVNGIKPTVYKTLADVPDWAFPTIESLVKNGRLKGDGNGNLNLTEDLTRALVVMSR